MGCCKKGCCPCCSWKVKTGVLLGLGTTLIIAGVILSAYGLPAIIEIVVRDEVQLVEGNFAYDNWQQSMVPLNFHVYLYNITNIDKLDTEAVKIEQVGPYVYQEDRYKEDIVFNPNGTITYMEHKGYLFQRDKSVGDETDLVNTVNVGVLGISSVIHGYCDMVKNIPVVGCTCEGVVTTILDQLTLNNTEKFYTIAPITEFVFSGAPVTLFQYLAECMEDPMQCINIHNLMDEVMTTVKECIKEEMHWPPWKKSTRSSRVTPKLMREQKFNKERLSQYKDTDKRSIEEDVLGEVLGLLKSSSDPSVGGIFPEYIPEGKFAMLYGTNNSQDGPFLIYDGVKYSEDFSQIVKYKNQPYLEFWDDWYCNQVNGTDGVQFPPYIEEDDVLFVFSSDVCRSLYLEYEKDVKIPDVKLKAKRFVTPERMMIASNPENKCYACDWPGCDGDGMVDMSGCQDGAPILMSPPHFYMADEKFLKPFEYFSTEEGKPKKEDHETALDIDQKTGTTLSAHKRIQINMFVRRDAPQLKILQNIKTLKDFEEGVVFPILWFDETATIDESSADEFKKEVITPVKVATAMGYVIIGIGVILAVAGGVYWFLTKRNMKKSNRREMLRQQSSSADLLY